MVKYPNRESYGILRSAWRHRFYPNGGAKQPQCESVEEESSRRSDSKASHQTTQTVALLWAKSGHPHWAVNYIASFISDSSEYLSCNHGAAPYFFLQSINTAKCLFRSVQCPSYDDFLDGQCPPDSSTTDLMGLPAQKIPGLVPKSRFYLRTMADLPYCLQDGDEPA
ncbi:lipase domain-containing protein [Caerostris extrusa]|uniref:Lipase domain-containing protein n=1 Tax=Caerostris extrusa TaxID=172846 RepID=A0AAV4R6N0_CAEEX|nr:lipase domain-containing protein [Caerostris extrusa]